LADPAPRTRRSTDERIAVGGVIASTVNVLSFQLFAALSVPVNMTAYLIANGDPPPKVASAGESDRAQWAGHLGFVIPWWYFAASGLITLIVAVLIANPRWRLAPTNRKYSAYRTTPGFLVFITFVMAGAQLGISTYYDDWTMHFGPYAVGTILCVVALVITLIVYRFGRKTAGGHSGRRAASVTTV
jgi:hypothetical protein